MNSLKLNFSDEALSIESQRSKYWEYLLFSQFLEDDISSFKKIIDKNGSMSNGFSFKNIKNNSDIGDIFLEFGRDLDKLLKFVDLYCEMVPKNYPAAFGSAETPASPDEIKMLSSKVANLYYEVSLFLIDKNNYRKIFLKFSEKNFDPDDELHKLAIVAIKKSNDYLCIASTSIKNSLDIYAKYIKDLVCAATSGLPSNGKHYVDISLGQKEALNAVQAAKNLLECRVNSDKFCEAAKFSSINEILKWLATHSKITLAELRIVLLPLDFFPSAFINDINERALDLTGVVALEDDGTTVVVQQEILLEVIAQWQG